MGINWRELFPTKLTVVIFLLYASLFIGQGIFVTASQDVNNSYSYNTVTVVLLTEVLKLLVSASLYCREKNLFSLLRDVRRDSKVMLLYFVPAFLYCLYNNLAFVNLSTFDPTTYYLLLQLRVVITGILFQMIFKKYLTYRQWISLVLLTLGCMIKQLNVNFLYGDSQDESEVTAVQQLVKNTTARTVVLEPTSKTNSKNMSTFDYSRSALLILAQTVCSCLAGVYNEHLLKNKGADVNIFVQNVFMYIDSIICNALVLLVNGQYFNAFTMESLRAIWRFNVIIIIVNNAAIGIVTSFFLKYMNSILKTFASALELVFTAVLCYFLFAIPIYINTALAIAVVSFAIYLYSLSPVVNTGKGRPLTKLREPYEAPQDERQLLDDDREMDMV